jgi:hypothetical protein
MADDDKTETGDPTTVTVAKTLWSENLIDLLTVLLQKEQTDDQVIALLKELKQKKFKTDYIIGKIKKSWGDNEANRVRLLLGKL